MAGNRFPVQIGNDGHVLRHEEFEEGCKASCNGLKLQFICN
uniref:Uncharacterized protein n=1 Tax=Apteryx owenii TaxID=8824 RepID=A0A8B9QEW8_APTOW